MSFFIPAIPTMYAGTQFRSRLEAKWAAFFDLIGWPWEYEPLDLDGYIPDFVVGFSTPLLVEVKPLLGDPNNWNARDEQGRDAIQKIAHSGWVGESLLVGAALFGEQWRANGENEILLGLHGQPSPYTDDAGTWWNPFTLRACCLGPVNTIHSYACIRCGSYDGNICQADDRVVRHHWREAGNRVQWRSPRAVNP